MLKPRFHVAYQLPWLLCAWKVLGMLPIVYTFYFYFYFFISLFLLFILFFIYYFLLFILIFIFFIILLGTQNDWAVVQVCQR